MPFFRLSLFLVSWEFLPWMGVELSNVFFCLYWNGYISIFFLLYFNLQKIFFTGYWNHRLIVSLFFNTLEMSFDFLLAFIVSAKSAEVLIFVCNKSVFLWLFLRYSLYHFSSGCFPNQKSIPQGWSASILKRKLGQQKQILQALF